VAKFDFRFIELFSGIGGFHQALSSVGGKVVFASEIDEKCIITYEHQFNFKVSGDIKEFINDIPQFDVLSAGFPCQPFSKAGKQEGFDDETRGDYFYDIIKIIKLHPECKFIILENVRNLGDNKSNWKIIQDELLKLNFFITEEPLILSPSDFGIPQNRERVYILGIRKDIRNQQKLKNGYIHISDLGISKYSQIVKHGDAFNIIDKTLTDYDDYILSPNEEHVLSAWQAFKDDILLESIGSPIWIDYFGVNDCDFYTNSEIGFSTMPDWKKSFVRKNREFYVKNKLLIDKWIKKYDMLNQKKTHKKFEWNCGNHCKHMQEGIIQFRQSGIRIKRPTTFPSLVAIVNTPIIWDSNIKKYRRITPREAANLQNYDTNYKFSGSDHEIYKQLGNSVNVRVIEILTESLLGFGIDNWDKQEKY